MCPGKRINLTCQATLNEILLQWSLTIPGRSVPELRFISSLGSAQSVTPLTVGQTVFQFFRTSTSPLISRMIINNVTVKLNGTRVDYSYAGSIMSTTTINVISNGMCYIYIATYSKHAAINMSASYRLIYMHNLQ